MWYLGRLGATMAAVAATTVAALAFGTDQAHTLPGVHIKAPPVIDGIVDTDKEWAGVPSGTGFVDEMTGQKAPVEMRFWLGYDDKYIYFAGKMQDPDTRGIKATNVRQNVDMTGDDDVAVEVDPFGNLTDFSRFWMNSKGGTKLFVAGGRALKNEWVGELVAKGRITADGWEVEARIPWAIMSLPKPGPRTLRINVLRCYSRTGRTLSWCNTQGGDVEQYGRWTGVSVPAPGRRILHLLPFGYFGAAEHGPGIVDGGLDMKTALTDRLEWVGSIRPDFRNIEENILALDYTHYQRYAAESRPFFLEGGDDFDPEMQMFRSQLVSDFDVGMKLYGKTNDKTTVGFLDANTIGVSNVCLGSVQYAPDHCTTLGATGTSYDASGEHNQGGYLNLMKQFGSLHVSGTVLGTDDTAHGRGTSGQGTLFYGKGCWSAAGSYMETSANYYPVLNPPSYVDFKGPMGEVYYDCVPSRGRFSDVTAAVFGNSWTHGDGSSFYDDFNAFTMLTVRGGPSLNLMSEIDRFEGIRERRYTASVTQPAYDPNRNFSLTTSWGDQQGSYFFLQNVGAAYRPVKDLQLSLSYQYMDLLGVSDQVVLTAKYDLNLFDSVSARVVEQDGHWNAYAAFNRTGNRGTEYYLILGDPNALSFHPSLIFKVTIPIEIPLR